MNMSFDVGFGTEAVSNKIYDVIIIGSGPAGLSAALYASRAHLDTLVLTGQAIGGQVALTNDVDNYPGFAEGLAGEQRLHASSAFRYIEVEGPLAELLGENEVGDLALLFFVFEVAMDVDQK